MVSIAPNQFRIEGTVIAKRKNLQLAGYSAVVIRLERIERLQGPEEFLDPSSKEITISVVDADASKLDEGMHIVCKVRKAPGHFFLIPEDDN